MKLFEGRVIISASTLRVFSECRRRFLYMNENEIFTDTRYCRNLITHRNSNVSLLELNRQNMTQISLESQLQQGLTVSASSLGQFKKCHKAFEYRITKTPYSDPIDITPFQFGTLVHKKMDAFVHGLKDKYGSLLEAPFKEEFKKFYSSEELKQEILEKVQSNDCWTESKQKVFTHFYEAILNHFKFINSIVEKGCEPQFNYWFGTPKQPLSIPSLNIPKIGIIGEIDHFYENTRGNLTIEDTKTSSSTFYLDYDQLHLYALALEEVYRLRGTPKIVDELNFNMVRLGKRHPIPFGKDQREAILVNLSALETSIELNDFPITRSSNCAKCPWKTLCERKTKGKREESRKSFIDTLKSNVKEVK